MADKEYSAKEAAVAVLKKAEELYKASTLAKGDWAKIHSKLKREGYSEESADKIDGAIKAKMNKSDEMGNNPDAQADAELGEKVEQDVQQHEQSNQDPAHTMKGHIKLAKFMGRMDHKKEQNAKTMDKRDPSLKKDSMPQPSPTASGTPQGIGSTISPGNPVAAGVASVFKSEGKK
jgi:hypothetical protein